MCSEEEEEVAEEEKKEEGRRKRIITLRSFLGSAASSHPSKSHQSLKRKAFTSQADQDVLLFFLRNTHGHAHSHARTHTHLISPQ